MKPNVPVYKLSINEGDEDTGVLAVALVDDPAIQRNWQAFANQPNPFQFAVSDKEKRIVSGPLMIANLPIYRADADLGEYYVVFDRTAIEKIALKFARKGLNNSVNMMHDAGRPAEGVYMFESFIIDRARGINPPETYKTLPDGSWFGSYKVDNEEVWNNFIKTGEFKGFSVEGNFEMSLYRETPPEKVDSWIAAVHGFASKLPQLLRGNTSPKKDSMSIIKSIREAFNKAFEDAEKLSEESPAQFTDALLEDGTSIQIEGEIAEGSKVFTLDADGNQTPCADGEYTLQDGTVITVASGTITAVAAPEAAAEEEAAMSASNEAIDALKGQIADLLSQFKAEKAKQEKELAFLRTRVQQLTTAHKSSFSVLQALAEEPAAAPAHKPATSTVASKKEAAIERLAAAMRAKSQNN